MNEILRNEFTWGRWERHRDPKHEDVFARLNDRIVVPSKVLCGSCDMRKEMLPRQADLFAPSANYQYAVVEGAGHFLHREKPEPVNRAIIDWLRSCSGGEDADRTQVRGET